MFDLDKWEEIFNTIRKNKLRTFLTAFGVFWGIFMLVMLLGAGQGMQNGVMEDFGSDATNSVWIFSGKTSAPFKGLPPGRIITFKEEDIQAVQDNLEGYEYIAGENWLRGDYTIKRKTKHAPFTVYGTGKDYFKIKIYQDYVAGRRLNMNDDREKRKVAVIGTRVAEVLFEDNEDPVGEYINIKGVFFKVVGVFFDKGWNGRFSERIYIPLSAYQQTFNPKKKDVTLFAVTTQTGVDGKELEGKIIKILAAQHQFSPDDPQAISSHNQEEQYKEMMGLFAAIKAFVWIVGLGTLIAGIVGVSNVMIIIVKDRTREIGIRKAVGATPGSIVSLILQESVIITAVSGYVGLVFGVALLELIKYFIVSSGAALPYFTRPEINFNVAVAATAILIIAGMLAGLVPALKAARIKPIEALRSE